MTTMTAIGGYSDLFEQRKSGAGKQIADTPLFYFYDNGIGSCECLSAQ
jgi:hypothetical protein